MKLNTLFENFSSQLHKAESDSSDYESDLTSRETKSTTDFYNSKNFAYKIIQIIEKCPELSLNEKESYSFDNSFYIKFESLIYKTITIEWNSDYGFYIELMSCCDIGTVGSVEFGKTTDIKINDDYSVDNAFMIRIFNKKFHFIVESNELKKIGNVAFNETYNQDCYAINPNAINLIRRLIKLYLKN